MIKTAIFNIDGTDIDIDTYQVLRSLHLAGGKRNTIKKLQQVNGSLEKWIARNDAQIEAMKRKITETEAKAKAILEKGKHDD